MALAPGYVPAFLFFQPLFEWEGAGYRAARADVWFGQSMVGESEFVWR